MRVIPNAVFSVALAGTRLPDAARTVGATNCRASSEQLRPGVILELFLYQPLSHQTRGLDITNSCMIARAGHRGGSVSRNCIVTGDLFT